METTAEFMAENQMLFFYLYSTTFQWFSFHSWINSLLYVLSIHWKTLILMNIMLLKPQPCTYLTVGACEWGVLSSSIDRTKAFWSDLGHIVHNLLVFQSAHAVLAHSTVASTKQFGYGGHPLTNLIPLAWAWSLDHRVSHQGQSVSNLSNLSLLSLISPRRK